MSRVKEKNPTKSRPVIRKYTQSQLSANIKRFFIVEYRYFIKAKLPQDRTSLSYSKCTEWASDTHSLSQCPAAEQRDTPQSTHVVFM